MMSGAGAPGDPGTLAGWGGNFWLRTRNGEWWRLVTSMFVHAGPLHLLVDRRRPLADRPHPGASRRTTDRRRRVPDRGRPCERGAPGHASDGHERRRVRRRVRTLWPAARGVDLGHAPPFERDDSADGCEEAGAGCRGIHPVQPGERQRGSGGRARRVSRGPGVRDGPRQGRQRLQAGGTAGRAPDGGCRRHSPCSSPSLSAGSPTSCQSSTERSRTKTGWPVSTRRRPTCSEATR